MPKATDRAYLRYQYDDSTQLRIRSETNRLHSERPDRLAEELLRHLGPSPWAAAQWRRIEQEEPFMARCGDVGDELGSRVEASTDVQAYPNWFPRLRALYEPPYGALGEQR